MQSLSKLNLPFTQFYSCRIKDESRNTEAHRSSVSVPKQKFETANELLKPASASFLQLVDAFVNGAVDLDQQIKAGNEARRTGSGGVRRRRRRRRSRVDNHFGARREIGPIQQQQQAVMRSRSTRKVPLLEDIQEIRSQENSSCSK